MKSCFKKQFISLNREPSPIHCMFIIIIWQDDTLICSFISITVFNCLHHKTAVSCRLNNIRHNHRHRNWGEHFLWQKNNWRDYKRTFRFYYHIFLSTFSLTSIHSFFLNKFSQHKILFNFSKYYFFSITVNQKLYAQFGRRNLRGKSSYVMVYILYSLF